MGDVVVLQMLRDLAAEGFGDCYVKMETVSHTYGGNNLYGIGEPWPDSRDDRVFLCNLGPQALCPLSQLLAFTDWQEGDAIIMKPVDIDFKTLDYVECGELTVEGQNVILR